MGYTLVTSYCILLESRSMCITLVSFSEESNKSGGISGSQSFQSWGSYTECLSITHDCKPSTAINHWSTCAYHKLGTEAGSLFNYATNKDHSWWELGCWPPGAELYTDLWAVEASVSKGLYCSCDGIYGTHNLCSFCSPRLIPVKSWWRYWRPCGS